MRVALREVCRGKSLEPIAFLLLLLITVAVAEGFAQQPDTGTISGKVLSSTGAPIVDARITITNKSTGQTVVARSDATGSFISPALVPDDYSLRGEAKSFITAGKTITVQAGAAAPADFRLDPEPVPGVLPARSTENLPVNGRNFLDYPQLEPAVQKQEGGTFDPSKNGFSSISFSGRFGRSASIEVDRIDISDQTVGTVTQNIPASAIEEFHLERLSAPVPDQLVSDAWLNITTRSGSNHLHGEGFGFYRNGAVGAASLPGGKSDSWEREQYGGALGGALIPDKLFFFLSAERNVQDLRNPVLAAGPFAFLSPLSTTIQEPFREIEGLGRLDYQFSKTARAFYRFAYDQNSDRRPFASGPSLQPLLTKTNTPAHTLGADLSSEAFTHSFRFAYLKFRNVINNQSAEVTGAANPIPNVTLNIGGGARQACAPGGLFCSGPSFLAPQKTIQSNGEFRYDGTHPIGAHLLRYGGSYDRILIGGLAAFFSLAPTLSDPGSTPVSANRALGSTGDPADPLNYPVEWAFFGNGRASTSERSQFGLPGGGYDDNRLRAYLGDVWKLEHNLVVSYGVDWVRDDGRTNSDLAPIPQLNAWGPKLGNRVRQPNLNFAPRLGAAWDPSGSGKTTIRGGIGLYYDNTLFNTLFFDRPLRLPTGSFFSMPAVCVSGAPGSIQWPTNPGVPGSLIANSAGIVNGNRTVSPTWCNTPVRFAAPLAVALEQTYQAATAAQGSAPNPSFIGNAGAFAGPYENGLSLLAPNYQTPRSVEMNLGFQHEFRPGLMFTFDYFRNVTTRTLLGVDVNHGGAAATFNALNALADRNAAQVANGCPAGTNQVTCMVVRLGPAGALAAYGRAGIGGPAEVTGGAPCSLCAFPGVNPNLGVNVMNFPVGRSVFSSFNVSLKQHLGNFRVTGIERASFEVSYAHVHYTSQTADSDFVSQATDYNNPTAFTGPTALDRTHQIAFGAYFEMRRSFRLSFMGQFDSPLPVTLTFPQISGGAEVLVTDVTGDGTTGDIIPGSNVGSYMRKINPGSLGSLIQNYNNTLAGGSNPATPAGNMLVNAGIFSLQDLEQMGGVEQALAAAVSNPVGLSWLKTLDVRLSWQHKLQDRITFEPSIGFFNVFNFANFDLPGNTQNGVLNFGAGSLSPSATALQPQNTVGGTSAVLTSPAGRSNRTSLQSGMNAQGAPRSLEWGLKISF
jgi:hypothetical protein